MISRLIPAFALAALVGASGCTIRTGEAADPHHHHNKGKSPPPPPPKKKHAEPKHHSEPAKPMAKSDPIPVDPGYRATEDPKIKWEKLGEATANGKNDHDVVQVGRAEGKFRALRFRVTHSNVKLQNVVVHFVDGTKFSPSTRIEFKEGDVSNSIDLPGARRAIKSVNFRYSDGKGSGAAQVEVWGQE